MHTSDSEWYITTVFQPGVFSGYVLTFTTASNSQLKYDE